MNTLYIKQKVFKITDHYPVYDENHNEVFNVVETFRFFNKKWDISSNGRHVCSVNKKPLHFLPTYTVEYANNISYNVKQRLSLLRKKINVNANTDAVDDLFLKGDFFDLNFSLYDQSGKKLATINKKLIAWGDTYELRVFDERYTSLFLALVIVVDNIKDTEEANND